MGESLISAKKKKTLVKSNMHLSEQNEDTKGQEDVGGKENYINERMSHHVLFSQLD